MTSIQSLPTPLDRNKKFLSNIIDNGDTAFMKLVEGLISNGQPFLGELLEREDKKTAETNNDVSERVVIDDEMLRKCPGIDKLRADTREKLKIYLQEQVDQTKKSESINKLFSLVTQSTFSRYMERTKSVEIS